MSEHAMHSQLPQILVGFGFRSAIMRSHYMMYGYNPTFDAAVGWWTGPDGSRIATVPTYKGEGAEFGRTTTDNWILTRCPGPDCKGSLEEFRAQYAHLAPAIATRADDSDLHREDLVRQTGGAPVSDRQHQHIGECRRRLAAIFRNTNGRRAGRSGHRI
jgi:alpha-mannosidase